MKNINFGIDLGTTNSGIGKFENGQITVFKNPVGFSDTLPSVVSFRKNRQLVGEKAREQITTNPENVVTAFKRKMGTDQSYFFPDINETKSPVELSSIILKELVEFVPGEKPKSIVITIPASFDTIQSNATKKAGYLAGFGEVVLLQEPIAACLAYANTQNLDIAQEKTWLVYDFGGGTFDVALVNINDKELKVIDHKGNNFLGGYDIDNIIVEKIICPYLEEKMQEVNLWKRMTSHESKKLSKLYFELLYKAEEAKKELSVKEVSVIELETEDDYWEIPIHQNLFNSVVEPLFKESFDLTKQLLDDNHVSGHSIERIILVGGTTYIPYIREQLHERFHIAVDSAIDPTTAVIIGAAYYSGSKITTLEDAPSENKMPELKSIPFQLIYESNSKDEEELLICAFDQPTSGLYRITRNDGGFDTGLIKFENKIKEFLRVLPRSANQFQLKIYNEKQELLAERSDIVIHHGIYNVNGQPLPNDICLELDDDEGNTYLERVFRKNEILPLSKTIYKTTSRTILRQSTDSLIINVVEGKAGTLPGSNLSIGFIELKSTNFSQNLLKGMEIELNFKMSESRDLSISIYISSIDLEMNEVFNPHKRNVSTQKLLKELEKARYEVSDELDYAEYDEENFIYKAKLVSVRDEMQQLIESLKDVGETDASEKKFRIDERKRQVLQEFDNLIRHKSVLQEISDYHEKKETVERYIEKATPAQYEAYRKLIKNEKEVLESNEKALIRKKAQELDKLSDAIYLSQDEAFISSFVYMRTFEMYEYKDKSKAKELINSGNAALDKGNYKELKYIVHNLYNLLINPPKNQQPDTESNLGIK